MALAFFQFLAGAGHKVQATAHPGRKTPDNLRSIHLSVLLGGWRIIFGILALQKRFIKFSGVFCVKFGVAATATNGGPQIAAGFAFGKYGGWPALYLDGQFRIHFCTAIQDSGTPDYLVGAALRAEWRRLFRPLEDLPFLAWRRTFPTGIKLILYHFATFAALPHRFIFCP
ncbi:MAG: hypothetical protein AAB676_06480 [Verrucomicrobiota bacterium]